MNLSTEEIETSLCSTYREMAIHYTQAIQCTDELLRALSEGQESESSLRKVAAQLQEVAVIEIPLTPIKQYWLDRGCRPGSELQAALADLASLIETLSDRVRAAESAAAAVKKELVPALEAAALGTRMRQAYGKSGRS